MRSAWIGGAALLLLATPMQRLSAQNANRTQAPGQAATTISAPLPAALATAKTLFIGNAGDQENSDCLRVYNEFYAGVNAIGRYRLVDDPGRADLVLELHYEVNPDAAEAGSHGGNSIRQFRVVVIDPHTRTVLWTLIERTNYATFKSNRNKNLDEVVGKLIVDVGSLISEHPVAPNNNSVTGHLW